MYVSIGSILLLQEYDLRGKGLTFSLTVFTVYWIQVNYPNKVKLLEASYSVLVFFGSAGARWMACQECAVKTTFLL